MSISRSLTAVLVAALCATSAQASNQIDEVQLQCSDSLAIDGTSALSLRCTGDFAIIGQNGLGRISADESLSLWASGSLSLQDVTLTAPSITLTSDNQLVINSGAQLNVGSNFIQQGPRDISGWETFDLGRAGSALVAQPAQDTSLLRISGSVQGNLEGYLRTASGSIMVVNTNGVQLAGTNSPALLSLSAVPEPGTGLLSLTALALAGLFVRSRRARQA